MYSTFFPEQFTLILTTLHNTAIWEPLGYDERFESCSSAKPLGLATRTQGGPKTVEGGTFEIYRASTPSSRESGKAASNPIWLEQFS